MVVSYFVLQEYIQIVDTLCLQFNKIPSFNIFTIENKPF